MSSVEENKAIVRRYLQEFSQGNLTAIDKYIDESCKPFVMEMASWLGALFSDTCACAQCRCMRLTIEDQIGEDDKVATRVTFRGIHRGEYKGIAPTGKEVAWQGIAIDRIVNGKVVEMWHEADIWGMMHQIGAV